METREMICTEEEALAKWGFDKDYCFRCKKHNSELDGLLMQCGKCKKAYYCGMACFNADLEEHQKYCNTKKYCHRDPDRILASEATCTPTSQKSSLSRKKVSQMDDLVSLSSKKSSTSRKSKKSTTSKKSKKLESGKKKKKKLVKKKKKTDSEDQTEGGGDKEVRGDEGTVEIVRNGQGGDGQKVDGEGVHDMNNNSTDGNGADANDGNDDNGNEDDDGQEAEIIPTEIFLGNDRSSGNGANGGNSSRCGGKGKSFDPNASGNSSWRCGLDADGSRNFNPNESWISNGYGDASWINRDDSDGEGSDEDGEGARRRLGLSAVSFDNASRSRNCTVRAPDQLDEKAQAAKEVVTLYSATQEERDVGWEKPAWSSELGMLRKTKNGAKLRSGVDVVRPISKGVDQ